MSGGWGGNALSGGQYVGSEYLALASVQFLFLAFHAHAVPFVHVAGPASARGLQTACSRHS